ncbi:MAG: ostA-like family protein [Micavibrio aeruginosavorus]|uniref:OstA-like family protein n=1 Tax=Micavibrio aeruginosavorus TaxID=349221 RepID=A0A2W5Q5Z6_9BACT|nr:MAG: ostA-like family protein [Micavibrio aeruginosavorus]
MKFFAKYALFLCASLFAIAPAGAQQDTPAPAPAAQTAPENSNQPIEITATKTVEWLRDQKQYVARENVIVKQGTMTIMSDLLVADYRESEASSMEIWQITATGNVKIMDDKNTAYGDKGVYDVANGIAVLTGNDLRLVSPDQTVTATQSMEYHANERQAKAIGNAKVVRAQDTLSADTITAFFKSENAAPATATTKPAQNSPVGGGNLDRLEADGNVVIKTPTETIRGQKGVYKADSNTANLTGKVKIERDKNTLEGNRAEVDLNTNVSKLFGSEKEGGRVRGVFFPGSEKSPKKAQDKPATTVAPVSPPAPTAAPDLFPPASAENTTPAPVAPASVAP